MTPLIHRANKAVLDKVEEIMSSGAPYGVKYEMLDRLYFAVVNHHPDGVRAVVLQAVSDAQTKTCYPEGGAKDK